jgi:hypothetical protein
MHISAIGLYSSSNSDQIKEEAFGGACNMHDRHEKYVQNLRWKI